MSGSGLSPLLFKRAQRGLFAGKQRLTGNNVSPSKRHTRRNWLPNVQRASIWSDTLGRKVSINVTVAALRQIDRVGGLDNYLLCTPDEQLNSIAGLRLRAAIMHKMKADVRAARYAAKVAEAAGAPAEGAATAAAAAAPAAEAQPELR